MNNLNLLLLTKPAKLLVFLLSGGLIAGCSNLPYKANPLDQQAITEKLINKNPSSPTFNAYLKRQGITPLPIQSWALDELTYCALFFNTTVNVAKTKWHASEAAINTANQLQTATINGKLGHSNLKNGDSSPWAYGLGVDIPIETANKREIRTEHASYEAEISHIELAQIQWKLRNQIALQLIDYHESVANSTLLEKQYDLQATLFNILNERFKLGMLSSFEINTAKLQQLKALQSLTAEQARLPELRAKLAASVGLTSEIFNTLQLSPLNLDATIRKISAEHLNSADQFKSLQNKALLNRLDIRASLARYAVAESQLKLEIAKQYPDITLSPIFAFEFGDNIWSLGISSLLSLLNKNASLVAEATSLREVEAANFEALQAKVIGDLSQAQTVYLAANAALSKAELNRITQLQINQQVQKQFNQGYIDRLELTNQKLNAIIAEQNLIAVKFQNLRAANGLEDVMQHPLYNSHNVNSDNN